MNASNDGSLSDFTLQWLEDETFFSICSRQHQYLGNVNPALTFTWLFGSPKAGTNHDFPFNLDSLNEKAKVSWGDATSIILEHTILPLFFPFQSPQNVEHAITTLKGSSLGSLKYRLGLLTGRFGAEHPLKACTECMASDRETIGVAYWHLTHQYPGVVLCLKHQKALRECCTNRQWSGRFQWHLPSEDILSPDQHRDQSVDELRRLNALSILIYQLARLKSGTSFNPETVSKTYRIALAEFSARSPTVEDSAASFACFTTLLQAYTPFNLLPTTAEGAAALLKQLTRPPRGHCHPLKHLILIEWLFGSLGSFTDAYSRTSITSKTQQVDDNVKRTNYQIQFPPTISYKNIIRRPKILNESIRRSILEKLSNGKDKETICKYFNITISTVNKLLRSEPTIRDRWIVQKKLANTLRYQQAWLFVTKLHPEYGVKRVRSCIPHVYAWLYRNDKLWLYSHIERLPIDRRGNNSNVDWLRRDAELFEAIRAVVSSEFGNGADVSREAIYFRFPKLAKCLEQGKHYPQTKSFIHQLFGRLKIRGN